MWQTYQNRDVHVSLEVTFDSARALWLVLKLPVLWYVNEDVSDAPEYQENQSF